MQAKRILVAPLDWGLGDATRCIPLIRMLAQKGCIVSIASSGQALALLQEEFPLLPYFVLPPYRARYSLKIPLIIKLFLQLPKFLSAIIGEHRRLNKIISRHAIDIVISDNRYGCRSDRAVSVFITHQINILLPNWLSGLGPMVNYFNHHQISRFDYCWVPAENDNGIVRGLITPRPFLVKHIGLLSRFKKSSTDAAPMEWDIAVILSGPEPQRTRFEEIVLCQLHHLPLRAFVIRGTPKADIPAKTTNHIQMANHLTTPVLQRVIERAKLVLCRSGYSSVMDLVALGKTAFFVPTPGQTEQEYIAKKLQQEGIAYCQHQDKFNLKCALKATNRYIGFVGWPQPPNLLSETVDELLQ